MACLSLGLLPLSKILPSWLVCAEQRSPPPSLSNAGNQKEKQAGLMLSETQQKVMTILWMF